MSAQEFDNHINDLKEGMALAEYNMLLEKAKRGEKLVMAGPDGAIIEVSARDHFIRMYGHDIPSVPEANN